jgi:hypothetical protein
METCKWAPITAALLFFLTSSLYAQPLFHGKEHLFTMPHAYYIYQVVDTITIDGAANERSWQNAPWSSYFTDIEGDRKPIYNNNDFELFIDPDGDTHQYYEIEVNVLKTIFDLYMDKPYRNGGKPHIDWDAAQIRTGITLNGTLNKPDDLDQNWTLEMAIPFSSLSKEKQTNVPRNNTIWRMNFSRVQWDLEIKENQYQRIRNTNNKLLPEHNWVWSEQGVINMHFPERWGYVIFSQDNTGNNTFTLLFPEYAKQVLWLIYYRQKDYQAEHKRYATKLAWLGFPSDQISIENQPCTLILHASEKEFIVTIRSNKTNERWQLNHEGLITTAQ